MGAPDWEVGAASTPGSGRHHHPSHTSHTTRHHPSGISDGITRKRQAPCYAAAWRAAYARGFRDALRLAERRLGPEAWHTLSRLADEYDLAGSDG